MVFKVHTFTLRSSSCIFTYFCFFDSLRAFLACFSRVVFCALPTSCSATCILLSSFADAVRGQIVFNPFAAPSIFMWLLRIVPKLLRRSLIRHQYLITAICFILCVETLVHINSYEVRRPPEPLDAPFAVGCQEPKVDAPRENATIVMLARNRELDGAIKSVKSIERQFNRWFHYPIVFLNDEPWDQEFIDGLTKVSSGKATFEVIKANMWGFPDWMDQTEARRRMKQQEAKGVMYAGLESYHHMCRFNSGYVMFRLLVDNGAKKMPSKFYDHEALKPYRWYWRLEPDVEFTCAIP